MGGLNVKDSCLAKDEDFKFTPQIFIGGYEVKGKGKGYFQYIGKEKIVEIPHTIQGHKMTSYFRMFEGKSVEKVISTNKNITDMSYMFSNSKTMTLDLSSFDTSKVKNMTRMFYKSNVTNLVLSSFNTKNVTSMTSMFNGSNVKELDLSSFDTSNVINMSHMFQDIETDRLNLYNFDTSNVTDMSWMFKNSSATTLDLSSFDTSNVTNMEGMFSDSEATIGYAKTQKDADRFNKTVGELGKITFVIKPKIE